jgi:phytoene dehydrogenase-like protein
MAAVKMRWRGEVRRMPPLRALPAVLRLRGRSAPTDRTFRAWATEHADAEIAEMLSAAAGSYTFHHDPGALSAAFVWERMVRTLLKPPPKTRYIIGGWGRLVESMEAHARLLGVAIETGRRVNELPAPPVILATELYQARMLLGDSSLDWPSGRTVCLDVALRHRRADPFIVSDLDEAGWVERFTEVDPTLAPDGEELVQAHMPIGPDEGEEDAMRRLERLLDVSLVNWRERRTWQRRMVMIGRSGALDAPGTSWRQRPAIRQRDGVFLAGDMTAVPGLLSEVAWASALAAAQGAREALVAGVLAGHP